MKIKYYFLLLTLITSINCNAAKKQRVITNDEVILHAWCWSFNTIRENLPDIAAAGYQIVQTSPVQHCVTQTKGDKGGGNKIFGKGYWYYHYQPTAWIIGNQHVGTRDELIALCNEAKKYGIRIIVDVLPNHTAIDDCYVEDSMDEAVGGHENLYHAIGFTEINDYNDRLKCTTGQMGGLPDVNTENPDFQAYYMTYVNDLLACGVRGFRYDTAKHIGLPSDPLDPKAKQNDFWDVATGRKSVKGISLALPMDSLFMYGEVLQDKNVKEEEYAEYMGLTASSFGYKMRNDLDAGNWLKDTTLDWAHKASPTKLITWIESHDTYCNGHESAHFNNEQLRAGWVYLAARQNGTPLFYSRPDGSDGPNKNYWGNNIIGKRGNDEFKHPIVAAANKFRAAMTGQQETVTFSENGCVAHVVRGNKGAVIVNISDKEQTLTIQTTLPNGKYKDSISGKTFIVKKGKITGKAASYGTYILYR